MNIRSAIRSAAEWTAECGRPAESRRCREHTTLACIGFAAALRRLNRRRRLRANLLGAVANITHFDGTTFSTARHLDGPRHRRRRNGSTLDE